MNAVQSDSVYLSWALPVLSFVCLFCRFALFLICCCLSYGCDCCFYCFLSLYLKFYSVYFYKRTPFMHQLRARGMQSSPDKSGHW